MWIGAKGVRPPAGIAGRLVPAPSPSGSNNPERLKGKVAFYSLLNICLSGLTKALPLLMTGETPNPVAAPSPSGSNNPQQIKGKITFFC
ncbi:hypothetical protein BSG1_20335 [Bacillus sp. SG-1]|nr:hypothetical protein BSG1_20335 [Bacillus sp. SG-1]